MGALMSCVQTYLYRDAESSNFHLLFCLLHLIVDLQLCKTKLVESPVEESISSVWMYWIP